MKSIVKLYLREGRIIDVLFDDGIVKRYDCLTMSNDYPILNNLKDRELFLKGKVLGNSGIYFNDDIDIDADSIYSDGIIINIKESITEPLLGYKIKQERIKQNLSQDQLSKMSGIDQSDISKIESGNANPTLSTINKLSSCLNCHLNIDLINKIN